MRKGKTVFGMASLLVLGVTACGPNTAGNIPSARSNVKTAYVNLTIDTNGPKYVPANFSVPANAVVHVKIINHDNGADPVAPSFKKVSGTLNKSETVNGKTVTQVKQVSHTFTVSSINLNVPVPPSSTVEFTFKSPRTPQTMHWQCFVPCGSGANGWGGVMATPGQMQGTVTVKA